MMRKFLLILLLGCSLLGLQGWSLPSTAQAGFALHGQYLNGDPNFPLAYGHGGSSTYVDLSSCTFVYNRVGSYQFAADVYTTYKQGTTEKSTVFFRQLKDGKSLPEYLEKGTWHAIPSWKYCTGNPHDYGVFYDFATRFCPWEHYEFLIIYEQLWGVSYSEL